MAKIENQIDKIGWEKLEDSASFPELHTIVNFIRTEPIVDFTGTLTYKLKRILKELAEGLGE